MNNIYSTFIFSAKTVFRNLKSSAIVFVLPIFFMGIFGVAFGGESNISFTLGIYQDGQNDFSLEEIYTQVSNENDNIEIDTIAYDNFENLKNDLESDVIDIGLSLPGNLSDGAIFEVLQDKNSVSGQINSTIVVDVIESSILQRGGVSRTILDENSLNLSGFDFLAPGLIVYGLIILIPSIAQSFSQISEKKYIFRYSFSKVTAMEIILGNVLFYFLIGLIQAFILYFVARLFGYETTGNIFIAMVPILLTLFFVVAIGLVIGSFFQKSEPATNVGTIVNIILGFFSGVFILGIGNVLEFDLFGRTFQFNDILPTKWGTVAVEKILTDDLGLVDIQNELWVLALSGIFTLAISIWVYSKKQLQNQY